MGKYDSGYEKIDKDFYATPYAITQALLCAELFSTNDEPLDPACGEGHIIDAGAELGIDFWGMDIRDTGRGIVADFLKVKRLPAGCKDIIANPPYGSRSTLAVRFIEHSLELTQRTGGRVCMLLAHNFDCGKTRKHLFDDCPQFARKYTITDRIRWANLPQKDAGPKENHAWFVWQWGALPGLPDCLYLHGTGV